MSLQVYGDYLYIGDYNDVSSALQNMVLKKNFQTLYTNLQGAGAGADALRVQAVGVFRLGIALPLGVASQHRPMPVFALRGIGAGQFAAHNGERGFHSVVRILRGFVAHADNNIHLVVELQHLVDTAAARIMDQMEQEKIIGPYEGAKPRAVLVTKAEWEERKLNGQYDG